MWPITFVHFEVWTLSVKFNVVNCFCELLMICAIVLERCGLYIDVYSLIPCNNGTGLDAINFAFCGGWPDAFWVKPGFVSCVLGGWLGDGNCYLVWGIYRYISGWANPYVCSNAVSSLWAYASDCTCTQSLIKLRKGFLASKSKQKLYSCNCIHGN